MGGPAPDQGAAVTLTYGLIANCMKKMRKSAEAAGVRALADVVADVAPGIPLRWHFHNTRNTGYPNAVTAVERGAVPGLFAKAGPFPPPEEQASGGDR